MQKIILSPKHVIELELPTDLGRTKYVTEFWLLLHYASTLLNISITESE